MRGSETEVFEGKTLSQLLKDIYSISAERRKDIKALIAEWSKQINSPATAVQLAPIIKELLEVAVKNDEQLTKIATVVQRIISADAYQKTGDPTELLTEIEKDQILKNAEKDLKEAMADIDKDVSKVPTPSAKN